MHFSCAQYEWTPGEIILQSNDTIHGEIKLKRSIYTTRENVLYRKTWDSKKINYDEYLVKKITFKPKGFDNSHYQYVFISGTQKALVRIITTGKVNLYARYNGKNGLETFGGNYWEYDYDDYNEFYVKRKKDNIAKLIIGFGLTDSFKKRAKNYFNDCASVVKDINDKFYRKQDIQFLVEDYNLCN